MDFGGDAASSAWDALPTDGEGVRAIIWDLDETLWRGTITEGGVSEHVRENEELIVALAQRGIVSSICSLNDFETVKATLTARDLWDYFVFPSIDWTEKGARVRAIVEALQLRPETVLFLDDNPRHLAAALAATPGLLVASEKAVAGLAGHPRLAGRDDAALARLHQYRLLERRHRDRGVAGGDARAFLRGSSVTVEIEHDVAKHIDRAVELVNRTNQLNFTKMRLPGDPEAAKRELREKIGNRLFWSGLVRVRDKYGDYGFVGFYLGRTRKTGEDVLHHFCFSCRTLGMDVETWVYRRLGAPIVHIAEPVVANLHATHEIDWINGSETASAEPGLQTRIREVRLRGGCELEALTHYFGPAIRSLSEINIVGKHLMYSFDSVTNLTSFLDGGDDALNADIAACGLSPLLSKSRIFAAAEPETLIVLSFWADAYLSQFRHRDSGRTIAVALGATQLTELEKTLAQNPDADIASYFPRRVGDSDALLWLADVARGLAANFHWAGLLDLRTYEQSLRAALAATPANARVALLQFPRFGLDGGPSNPRLDAMRDINRRIAAEHEFARVFEIDNAISDPSEIGVAWHFDRIVYFRLFGLIREALAGAWSAR